MAKVDPKKLPVKIGDYHTIDIEELQRAIDLVKGFVPNDNKQSRRDTTYDFADSILDGMPDKDHHSRSSKVFNYY